MIDCGTAGWPTVERVSRQHCLLLWAADVTACLGSDLLSEAVINDSISLDIGTLSHLHWLIALTFFSPCVCVCVFPIYRPWGRENTCQSNLSRGTAWLFNVRLNTYHAPLTKETCPTPWFRGYLWLRNEIQIIVTTSVDPHKSLLISYVTV